MRPRNVTRDVWHDFPSLVTRLSSPFDVVSARLKNANGKEMKFEDVVKSAEQAAVLVLVY